MSEQDQHELQTRMDMREAAEDVLQKYADAKYATSSRMAAAVLAKHVLTLLDESDQVCMVATELTRQIETIIKQRDKMAELLRGILKEVGELSERDHIRGYVRPILSLQTIDDIMEAIQ